MSSTTPSWLPALLELRAEHPNEAFYTLSLRLEFEKGIPGVSGRQVQKALKRLGK